MIFRRLSGRIKFFPVAVLSGCVAALALFFGLGLFSLPLLFFPEPEVAVSERSLSDQKLPGSSNKKASRASISKQKIQKNTPPVEPTLKDHHYPQQNPAFKGNPSSYETGRTIFVTIETGERIQDVIEKLEELKISTKRTVKKAIPQLDYPHYPFSLPPQNNPRKLEGLIAPGQYRFKKNKLDLLHEEKGAYQNAVSNTLYVLEKMLSASSHRFNGISSSHGLDPYQKLILASIVQKEAVESQNYDMVASVLYNRLNQGLPLASCPSVEYALGYHRPFLTNGDIRINSPYNLYVRQGLPPTPICMVSSAALEAVEHPIQSNYYYFVYDWTRHRLLFSRTYQQHLAKVEEARTHYIQTHGTHSLYEKFYNKYYQQ
ncbi:MAG: endolytic transglycosylase MltG [Spirochaetota bacterium]